MGMSFFGGCASGADEADIAVSLGETDEKQMVGSVVADDKFPMLTFRMVWISEDTGKRIGEHSHGIIESDTVFAEVG